jgi:hypothetical protein
MQEVTRRIWIGNNTLKSAGRNGGDVNSNPYAAIQAIVLADGIAV